MDGEATGAGAGTVQDPNASGGGTGGGTGSGGGGGAAESGAAGGGEGKGGAKEFDRAKLHPALRDMQPEEITELFESMATSLRTVKPPAREPLDELSGVPRHAREVPPPRREEPAKELTKEELKEFFNPESDKFDPEGAFRMLATKNYGHLFGDINMRTIRGMMGTFRNELPDFKDYEQEVVESLTNSGRDPSTLTERDVLTMYFTAKGMRSTLKEKQEAKTRSRSTLPPTPNPEEKGRGPKQLSALEEEVARRMFRKEKDPIAAYRSRMDEAEEGGVHVKVPIGGGKKE